MFSNLHLAPPPKIVDGLFAVPIDIQHLAAHVVLNAATGTARVEATMRFLTGNVEGHPVFDLRQTIRQADLDGVQLEPARLQHHDFGGGVNAELRVIEARLPASSLHTLRLAYELGVPMNVPKAKPITWDMQARRLTWDFWLSDLWAARYLEMWLPSNLIYDQFALDLDLAITDAAVEHVPIANAQTVALGANHWRLTFPERFTSLSPMLVLAPRDELMFRSAVLPLGGLQLRLDMYQRKDTGADLAAVEADLKRFIAANIAEQGPYLHGDRFTAYIWPRSVGRSMEYEGGITSTTDDVEHEVFHNWYGRGVKPASQNDGWFDEGWDVWNMKRFPSEPLSLQDPPVWPPLCSDNAYNRVTPGHSEPAGSRFFAGLAAELGTDNLRSYLRSFYQENKGMLMTTAQLEAYLVAKSGVGRLAELFRRFVYGIGNN